MRDSLASTWVIGLALGLALALSCGPSVQDDDSMASDDSAQDGEIQLDPKGNCWSVGCDDYDALITGSCNASAWVWDGDRCVEVTGCNCRGNNCCHLTATFEECMAKVAETCEGVAACLDCAPGTQCVQYCSHLGTIMTTYCMTCDGGQCSCSDVCTGICGGVCVGAHPDAIDCVE